MPVKKKTLRACPICGAYDANVIYHLQDDFAAFEKLPKEYDIVSCGVCGFVYADVAASQAVYDEYYAQFSVYDNMGITYGLVSNDSEKEVWKARAEEITRLVSPENTVLEIGSANGFLLEALRERGFRNLSALDLSRRSLDELAKKGFRTHLGGIFGSGMPADTLREGVHSALTEQYDCVCLTQVLEHIYDVQGAVQNMKRMLKPGGWLYIEVPDAGHFSDFETFPYSFFSFEHIGYFDEPSLRELAVGNGLEVAEMIHKKVHFSTSRDTYPYITGIFKKPEPIRSAASAACKAFLDSSEKKMQEYAEMFDDREIAFWGIGNFARELLKRVNGSWNIKYLVDSNPLHEGKVLMGHPVITPGMLKDTGFSGTVLITTMMYQDEVENQIRQLGLGCRCRKFLE